ncbi:hypothetical protein H4R33_005841 [Dimargaris cristalligena]|nr:hypothetical protein H4R33_005841 [Dimargaris cristalligena]
MSFVVEYARAARSKCKGSACNQPIAKNELRLAVVTENTDSPAKVWYHLECVTSEILQTITAADTITDFEKLTADDQARVTKAVSENRPAAGSDKEVKPAEVTPKVVGSKPRGRPKSTKGDQANKIATKAAVATTASKVDEKKEGETSDSQAKSTPTRSTKAKAKAPKEGEIEPMSAPPKKGRGSSKAATEAGKSSLIRTESLPTEPEVTEEAAVLPETHNDAAAGRKSRGWKNSPIEPEVTVEAAIVSETVDGDAAGKKPRGRKASPAELEVTEEAAVIPKTVNGAAAGRNPRGRKTTPSEAPTRKSTRGRSIINSESPAPEESKVVPAAKSMTQERKSAATKTRVRANTKVSTGADTKADSKVSAMAKSKPKANSKVPAVTKSEPKADGSEALVVVPVPSKVAESPDATKKGGRRRSNKTEAEAEAEADVKPPTKRTKKANNPSDKTKAPKSVGRRARKPIV